MKTPNPFIALIKKKCGTLRHACLILDIHNQNIKRDLDNIMCNKSIRRLAMLRKLLRMDRNEFYTIVESFGYNEEQKEEALRGKKRT